MSITSLTATEVTRLRSLPLTYREVGATQSVLPEDYPSFSRTKIITGDFGTVAAQILGWQVQSRAGFTVRASAPTVEVDAVVLLRAGVGPIGLTAPCRVVYVVNEPHRQGFGYGTLPGHPESGEESFMVELRPDERLDFTVTAFSRPATRLARLGGPMGRGVQQLITTRYLNTLG